MEDYNFEIEDALGRKVVLNCLATIKDNDNNEDYLIYTDGAFDEEGDPVLYVAQVVNTGESVTLEEVTDYEHIDIITKQLDKIIQEYKEKTAD